MSVIADTISRHGGAAPLAGAAQAGRPCGQIRTTATDRGGVTWEPGSLDDCADAGADLPPATCAATVSDYEGCVEALAADVCADTFPTACAPLLAAGCS